jgi:GNAT superfamily N-acetyltransferase
MRASSSPEIQIRLARPQDSAAIVKVLHESFVEHEALYTREGFAATTPDAAQMLARMAEGPVWIALHDAEMLGTVAAVAKGSSLYMRGMAVLPAARGSGVGARLLEQVEQWAESKGCRQPRVSEYDAFSRSGDPAV